MILTGLQESNLVRKCLNLVTSDPLCITRSQYILFVIVKIWITGALTGLSPYLFFFLSKNLYSLEASKTIQQDNVNQN